MGQSSSNNIFNNNPVSSLIETNNNNNNNQLSLVARKVEKQKIHIIYDIENWYKIFEQYTIKTQFLDITPIQAQCLIDYYQTCFNHKSQLNLDAVKCIKQMHNEIQSFLMNTMKSVNCTDSDSKSGQGYFVRLSSRSPKDGTSRYSDKFKNLFQQELRNISHFIQENNITSHDIITSNSNHANLQVISYFCAQSRLLCVYNADDILNLILTSERIFIDLLEALDCYSIDKNNWFTKLALREWNDLIKGDLEFRCFIYNTKLTAISQYNHYCKFPILSDNLTVESIKTAIITYWNKSLYSCVLDNPQYSNSIIDIALIQKNSDAVNNKNQNHLTWECVVIELNPFHTSTGSGLYDWKIDLSQLKGEIYNNLSSLSSSDIELRVRLENVPKIEEMMQIVLDDMKTESSTLKYETLLEQIMLSV